MAEKPAPANIVLFGFMACGKTSVARSLADNYGFRLLDTDLLVTEKAGLSIPEIFNKYGEAHFRELEAEAVKSLRKEKGLAIATGGGVIENSSLLAELSARGIPVYLELPFSTLTRRIMAQQNLRPLAAKGLGELRRIFDRRLPLYEALEYRIHCVESSPDSLATELFRLYCSAGGIAPV